MASEDLIFPLLPRNTTVAVESGLDRVSQLQKKQKIKGVAGDEANDDTQQARIEERQRKQQEQRKKRQQGQQQSAEKESPDETDTGIEGASNKGRNLDTYA
ncbi:hypothetical protein CWE15_07495 [Aliidiomarina taiwanensis]|uniref:Uncharacterized protein n=1 Tax=Aliidiomarina taiwanensis TaxID=946228 RepID=A0A432X1Z2_9GAMM|nr:hypothetical protein [Aliidiomarina taiwanensis]RUO40580.1 hypothetical protein CWE15_07495 [Aliidiomarina taiwanensis]